MVTATVFWFWLTLKTRLWLLPLMASRPAPGPSMSRLLLIASSPLVSVIVWPLRLGAKTIVSPLLASLIVSRRDPAPLSRFVQDRQGAGDGAIFQQLQMSREGAPAGDCGWMSPGVVPTAVAAGTALLR